MNSPFQMAPLYPPELTEPMRQELIAIGVVDLRTPEQVDKALQDAGTTLVIVNSVCGCAAGGARPAVGLALQHSKRPDRAVTVFAGVDREAVERARSYFKGYLPSSPQIALLRDGEVVFVLQRHDIEGRDPFSIARDLTQAFDRFC
jgi:putative YphP/YqiW family bacilliredoxin